MTEKTDVCQLSDKELILKARFFLSKIPSEDVDVVALLFSILVDRFEKLLVDKSACSCKTHSGVFFRPFSNINEVIPEEWIEKKIFHKGDLCRILDVSTKGFVVTECFETNVIGFQDLFHNYSTGEGSPVGFKVIV